MTDKEKIRNIIELFIAWNGETEPIDVANIDSAVEFIDGSLQEEPVSEGKDIFDSCLKSEEKFILPQKISGNINCENCLYSSACALGDIQACIIDKPVSEELEKAAEDYSNNLDNIVGSIGKQTRNAFKAGAQWQKTKDESTTDDLGEYLNELSKQFPEVSFAKLSRIAVRVAKWQKKKYLWKPADGDDLPEIDREVIAILGNGKVVYTHRPPEYCNYPKYDKGGWNIPDIKFWLDVSLPKEKNYE